MTREDLIEKLKEALYGHSREKAIEWAKEDKFDGHETRANEILKAISSAGLAVVPREPTPEMLDAYLRLYPSLKMGIKAGDLLVGEG